MKIDLKPVETLVAKTESVAMGRFVCPATHELFADSGPCTHHTIVFPRTSTHVVRDDDVRFVGDPTTVIFYNQNQCYTRSKLSEVDECDWIVIADDLLFDLVGQFDPDAGERRGRPFRVPFAFVGPDIYLAQRRLFNRTASGEPIDSLALDEAVVAITEAVLGSVSERSGPINGARGARAAADRAEIVRRAIASDVAALPSLSSLATSASCSRFELCRSFRMVTGMTISEYRTSLRMRIALGKLRDGCSDLTGLALDLGFSSHSHFTFAFRTHFGMPPSAWRALPSPASSRNQVIDRPSAAIE